MSQKCAKKTVLTALGNRETSTYHQTYIVLDMYELISFTMI